MRFRLRGPSAVGDSGWAVSLIDEKLRVEGQARLHLHYDRRWVTAAAAICCCWCWWCCEVKQAAVAGLISWIAVHLTQCMWRRWGWREGERKWQGGIKLERLRWR